MSPFNYPPYFSVLQEVEQSVVENVILRLSTIKSVLGVRWGGSTRLLSGRAEWADADLWVLVRNKADQEVKEAVLSASAHFQDVVFILDAGYFEFLGHLVQLFFFSGCTFGVDIGICTRQMLQTATPGAGSVLVWGSWPNLENQRQPRTGPTLQRRLSLILLNLVKVRKALRRGYLWNAIEYTSRARRQLMGLIIGDGPTTEIRYSRADHSVEAVISQEDLNSLSVTCPVYSRQEIGRCASCVGQMSVRLAEEQGIVWAPIAQLRLVTESIKVDRVE